MSQLKRRSQLHSNVGQTHSNDGTHLIWFNKSNNTISSLSSTSPSIFTSSPSPLSQIKLICNTSTDNIIRLWEIKSSSKSTKCLNMLRGHRSLIKCLIWLATSNEIISGSLDAQIKVWSLSLNECVRTLYGHSSSIECLLYVDKGDVDSVLISSSLDCSIKVWRVNDGTCLRTLESHLFWVKHLLYLPLGE